MSKHTPGPWRLEEADGAAYVCMQVKAIDGESLMGDERYYPWVPSNIADWHLIASAPELLSELKKARDVINALPKSLGYGFTNLRSMDAAIAKAEGAQ